MSTRARNALFVVPYGHGDGFQARVGGHVVDLIDPSSYALAPTADDLLVLSMASPLAWSARPLLRTRQLPDYVGVAAEWQLREDPPGLDDINLTVKVSRRAETISEELTASLERTLASRSFAKPVLHISFEE
jgi:hypothetical protein